MKKRGYTTENILLAGVSITNKKKRERKKKQNCEKKMVPIVWVSDECADEYRKCTYRKLQSAKKRKEEEK